MDYFILHRANPLITVSQTEAETLRRKNADVLSNLLVAPNGGWLRDLPPSPRLNVRPFLVSRSCCTWADFRTARTSGGYSRRRILAGRGVTVRLAGRPSELCAQFLAALDEGRKSHIQFCGYVDDEQLARLYREADCLMYPSLYEASGLPPTEAMHFGCPVVAADLPALRERCGDAALYCDPADIAARVLEIVDDSQLAARLSAGAVERARPARIHDPCASPSSREISSYFAAIVHFTPMNHQQNMTREPLCCFITQTRMTTVLPGEFFGSETDYGECVRANPVQPGPTKLHSRQIESSFNHDPFYKLQLQ